MNEYRRLLDQYDRATIAVRKARKGLTGTIRGHELKQRTLLHKILRLDLAVK